MVTQGRRHTRVASANQTLKDEVLKKKKNQKISWSAKIWVLTERVR
jgi:hypothetical protein